MAGIIYRITSEQIQESLEETTRQYLVGQLQRPQILEYLNDEKLEIGITSYKTHSSEQPHTHSQAYEYQLMLSGYTTYIDIESGEEISFRKGDFYVITPGVKYAQKSKPGTTILFIKVPPGNDKINLHSEDEIKEWLSRRIKTLRTDHFNNDKAPKANSLKPAVAVALFNEQQELLLLKRSDSGNWTLPGGTLEFGENLTSCGIREVKEETGYDIEITSLIGSYTNPYTVVEYSDGEVRQEFTILYLGRIVGGQVAMDDESTEIRWQSPDAVYQLPLAKSQRQRIEDVFSYLRDGKQFLR